VESESSSTELKDQLQGPAVQDQELSSGAGSELTPLPESAVTAAPTSAANPDERTKVVVHFADRIIKGFISPVGPDEPAESRPRRGVIRVRRLDGVLEEIALIQTQGVYFVKEFEEDKAHESLLFYTAPPLELLWARLTFKSGDVIEGLIDNGPHLVMEPGFLVTPTDPTGNNRFIFVMKSQLKDFKVLGLRHRNRQAIAMR
jgi:hypothetical protein